MNKHKKIIIATCVGFTNRGSEALLRTRISSIKKFCPEEVTFSVLVIYRDSFTPIDDVEYIQTFAGQREKLHSLAYLVKSAFSGVIWSLDALVFRFFGYAFSPSVKKLSDSDIFISTDGDVLGEDYGLFPFLWRVYFLGLGIVLKKPVVIYSEGIGPFYSKIGKIVARYFFDRCAYISVRDEISLNYLKEIKVKVPVILTADSAFVLPAGENPSLNLRQDGKLLIGIAVSKLATQYGFGSSQGDPYQEFLDLIGKIVDWLVNKYDATVVLIPHVVQVGRDDYEVAKDIVNVVKSKNSVSIAGENLSAVELKGIISNCDLLIASRMHASIAALSTGVPVVGIAYSHKMKGIFSLLGVESVVDIQKLDWGITRVISRTLADALTIRSNLKRDIEALEEKAEIPAREVARILSGN